MNAGWVQKRRGILDHLQAGELPPTEYAVHDLLLLLADSSTGGYSINANGVKYFTGGTIPLRSAQRALRNLHEKGFIWYRPTNDNRVQPYFINRYLLTTGTKAGCKLDLSSLRDRDSVAVDEVLALAISGHETGDVSSSLRQRSDKASPLLRQRSDNTDAPECALMAEPDANPCRSDGDKTISNTREGERQKKTETDTATGGAGGVAPALMEEGADVSVDGCSVSSCTSSSFPEINESDHPLAAPNPDSMQRIIPVSVEESGPRLTSHPIAAPASTPEPPPAGPGIPSGSRPTRAAPSERVDGRGITNDETQALKFVRLIYRHLAREASEHVLQTESLDVLAAIAAGHTWDNLTNIGNYIFGPGRKRQFTNSNGQSFTRFDMLFKSNYPVKNLLKNYDKIVNDRARYLEEKKQRRAKEDEERKWGPFTETSREWQDAAFAVAGMNGGRATKEQIAEYLRQQGRPI